MCNNIFPPFYPCRLFYIVDSLFGQTSLIYAEKFEFENPAIMEDK